MDSSERQDSATRREQLRRAGLWVGAGLAVFLLANVIMAAIFVTLAWNAGVGQQYLLPGFVEFVVKTSTDPTMYRYASPELLWGGYLSSVTIVASAVYWLSNRDPNEHERYKPAD